jgi:hypothetical protein
MEVNDDAGSLTPRGALGFFASKLAPTGPAALGLSMWQENQRQKQKYPIHCRSWLVRSPHRSEGGLTADKLFIVGVHIHSCGNGHLWFRPYL